MWELDHKEIWAPKNWWFWTVVLEKTLECPLDSKEIKLVNPKGNQPWSFIGKISVEAETPILWPLTAKSWLIGKDPDAGKGWRKHKKRVTGWNCWMASLTQLARVCENSGRWRRAGKPGVRHPIGSQRVRHDAVTEQQKKIFFCTPLLFLLQFQCLDYVSHVYPLLWTELYPL